VVVVSIDTFNSGLSGLVIVVPITSKHRGIPSHVPVVPPEGGLRVPSVALCEAVRSIDRARLLVQWGSISEPTMEQVEDWLRILMGL
jgi:mRNA interferase MazF